MSTSTHRVCVAAAIAACGVSQSTFGAVPSDLTQLDFFEKKIRPVLVESCYECHSSSSKKLKGGLLLDTSEGMLKGGDSGPSIVPGNPAKSLLLQTMRHEGKDEDLFMPPKKDKLTDAVIADFEQWVKMGAPDPRTGKSIAKAGAWDITKKAADHWAFKKITNPPVPKTADPKHFVQNPINSFVLAKLGEKKLQPSAEADRHTLIRRVTYDLTGLPPTPAEVDAFLADKSPNAFEKIVDGLLASPRYGERWARHWLDIARYADTSGDRQGGGKRNPLFPHAWTYRDYVIQAFNKDVPYDRFIVEQIAADRLPEAQQDKNLLTALGFLTVGKRFMGNENDVLDDRIDVVTKGLMGLTGACARCHDHKFDPIPTKDYYSLHGIFSSSEEKDAPPIIDPEKNPAYKDYLAEVARVEKELESYRQGQSVRLLSGMLEKAGDYMLAVHEAAKTSDTRKKGDNFRFAARNLGLKAEMAAIWMDRLKAIESEKKADPIFSPWIQFASLPADKFVEQAPAIVKEIAASKDVNPAIAKALSSKTPASMKDVAAAYTEVLEKLRTQLKLPEFVGYKGGARASFDASKTKVVLADADMETLRKQIYSGESPMTPDERTMQKALGNQFSTQQNAIRGKISALDLTHPGAPVKAMAVFDKSTPRDSKVLVRGEPGNPGPVAPRQFLTILSGENRKPFTDGSGRLELARAIASRDNPLTARVIVNRVWQWHFGQAIVRTVSDFGTRSEPPTHPEMIDWLATWLMDNGWSMKKLHKLIVMSATYQQDSLPTDAATKTDPTNQWLSHFNIQRLDFEEVRDSLLTLGGKLDVTMGGQPFSISGSGSGMAKGKYGTPDMSNSKISPYRRTVYAMIDRSGLPEMFNTFDFANPDMTTGERVLTTVPQQALFMMNSPFVAETVRNLLARPDFPAAGTDDEKVNFIFRTVFQRAPRSEELELARKFLSSDSVDTAQPVAPAPADAAKTGGIKKAPSPQSAKSLNTWERYVQVVLLTNELIYLN